MKSPTHYACCGKKMLGWIDEKMATPESAQEVANFLSLVQPLLEKAPQLATTRALHAMIAQLPLGIIPGTTHIHLTCLARVKGWAKS
jgi:hypothetical protein